MLFRSQFRSPSHISSHKLTLKFFFILLPGLFVVESTWAQENEESQSAQEKIETVWQESAVTTVLFNQSSFNKEWQAGGVSNVSGNINLNYTLNYNKNGVNWDTKVTAEYGSAKIEAKENLQKTNDRLEVISVVGKKKIGRAHV